MKQVIKGNHAVSHGVNLSRVEVISAYPITPQTTIVEKLSEMCAKGELDAEYIKVESEHSAMAALLGASTGGVRTFTATSGNGLLYMHEMLHWTAGARLPIVMVNVNRAVSGVWNIGADQTDSLSQQNTGWIQIYCESNQEGYEYTINVYPETKVPITHYLKQQGRFKHITPEMIENVQKLVERKWDDLVRLAGGCPGTSFN